MVLLNLLQLWRINETTFNFRVFNKDFVGLDVNGNGTQVVAVSKTPGSSETFEIIRKPDDLRRVRIKAPNGFFLQVMINVPILVLIVEINCDGLIVNLYMCCRQDQRCW